jgi:hypothetical protein
MIAIGEDAILLGKIGAAAIDEVEAGQAMLPGDLLRAQMLAHGFGEEGAALHRRVVGDQHAGAALHDADAGDDAGARHLVAIEPPGGERREFEERRLRIEQEIDALAHHDLSALLVAGAHRVAAAGRDQRMALAQSGEHRRERGRGAGCFHSVGVVHGSVPVAPPPTVIARR